MTDLILSFLIACLSLSSLSCANPAAGEQKTDRFEDTTVEFSTETTVKADTPTSKKPAEQPSPKKKSVVNATKVQNTARSAVTKAPEREVAEASAPPSHELWEELLGRYVSQSGQVDYSGLQTEQKQLTRYLDALSENPPSASWSRDERLAYWINAYNAFTVQLILQHYPVSSIRDIYNGQPWDRKWITIGGESYSLNNIEHDIIRERFDEPRIHFAVNCAARSCPPLANQAFTASRLENMLTRLTRDFLTNPQYNNISAKEARVSKIFDWYSADFGNINRYLQQYFPETITPETSVSFMEYNWALNEK